MNINLLVSVLISHILCFCFKNPTYLSHSYLLMEPRHKNLHNFESEALPPIKNQEISIYQSPFTVSDSTSPMLAVAILSVMGTAFLLLSYYIFINKWCSNWHQFSLLRRLSSFHTQRHEDPFIALSPTMWNRGLEESMIREIPAFQFEREGEGGSTCCRCVVCLSQFRETEMLRVLPNCSHTFHLDCIDIWLQSNSNCPLCRTSISGTTKYPIDHIVAPSSSPQNSQLLSNSLLGSDEDFVVIELGGEDEIISSAGQQESDVSREVLVHPINHSPKKFENKVGISKTRKCHHVSIMGDEGIHVREKDDQFFIQPIRRSFSMDSAADQQLYLTVQTIIHQGRQFNESSSSGEDDSIIRRSFFPFRQGRGSKNAILPLQSDI